ncbi:hypothetical protein [Magnetospirillum sp. SS-4]|uniref:hypothetical protein n=1 Tax=Magnetospirillum sp. SS-4 TaxID=2681465 RepID=UPI0015743E0E|nr:hypothetical protein [Magnetospirillum sp. SS-4]
MTPRSVRAAALALTTSLVLSGCSMFDTKKEKAPPCPPIYILSDAAKVVKYRPGQGRDITDVEIEAEIIAFKGHCTYGKAGVEVEIQVSFDVRRGPAGTAGKSELEYFVAIPKYYPAPEAKAIFTVPVEFPKGMDQARTNDEDVVMRIPVGAGDIVNQYEIYLGFQASPEELEINRRMKR